MILFQKTFTGPEKSDGMMQKEPRVAIIILNWNGFDDTVKCLESLRGLEYRNYKVVLVDNGSDNDEAKRLKDLFSDVHLIQNTLNRGFAGGNNDGANWAVKNDFDYIVNLNNDCVVEKNWLSVLVGGLKSENADFGSSRIMFYPDTHLVCSYKEEILADGSTVSTDKYKGLRPFEVEKIIFACGAASIYSAKCLKDVKIKGNQFFDELFFAYCEDVDLGLRLRVKGYKGVSIPNAVVYHHLGKTAGQYSAFNKFNMEKNRILVEILNYPFYLMVTGEIFYFIKYFLKMLFQVLAFKKTEKYKYIRKIGFGSLLMIFLKARIWIVVNLFRILDDRKERKLKGMISSSIFKNFYWKWYEILNT
jgi:GT2 family glycosyltransferase